MTWFEETLAEVEANTGKLDQNERMIAELFYNEALLRCVQKERFYVSDWPKIIDPK